MKKDALLALEDGNVFYGESTAIDSLVCGEVVFNTSMTGHQEICTDPSYANQIVLLTVSHVGNVGTNQQDFESDRTWLKGLLVKELSKNASNWRSEVDFVSFLNNHQVPWIEGIDTRKLTRYLRENGSKNGCIMIGNIDPIFAIQQAKNYIKAIGLDLTKDAIKEKILAWENAAATPLTTNDHLNPLHLCVYDFGLKFNILRTLKNLRCNITVIPNNYSVEDMLLLQPDGIVLSNGPGDPASAADAIDNVRKLISTGIPILGICFGCQLIGLAAGGQTRKMKFGHHGANHPVYNLKQEKVYITSQNHNFVIDENFLPPNIEITHRSLFDGSIQGIKLRDLPVIGFQGHPEGSPGPQDIIGIFDAFLDFVRSRDLLSTETLCPSYNR